MKPGAKCVRTSEFDVRDGQFYAEAGTETRRKTRALAYTTFVEPIRSYSYKSNQNSSGASSGPPSPAPGSSLNKLRFR